MKQMANDQMNEREIFTENLSGLMKRWNASHKDLEEAMVRYNMDRSKAEALVALSADDIQKLAGVPYSLFQDNLNPDLLKLVPTIETSKELAQLLVMFENA